MAGTLIIGEMLIASLLADLPELPSLMIIHLISRLVLKLVATIVIEIPRYYELAT